MYRLQTPRHMIARIGIALLCLGLGVTSVAAQPRQRAQAAGTYLGHFGPTSQGAEPAGINVRMSRGGKSLVIFSVNNSGAMRTSQWRRFDVVLDVPTGAGRLLQLRTPAAGSKADRRNLAIHDSPGFVTRSLRSSATLQITPAGVTFKETGEGEVQSAAQPAFKQRFPIKAEFHGQPLERAESDGALYDRL